MRPIERRDFLRAGGFVLLGAAAAACAGDKGGARSIDDLIGGRPQNASLVHANAELLSARDERFAFALFDAAEPTKRLAAESTRVWIAQTREEPAQGPFTATYRGEGLGDRGVFATQINFATDGAWIVLVEASAGGSTVLGGTTVGVGRQHQMPIPGEKAISVPTPTAEDHRGVEPYCTRVDPKTRKRSPCSMHAVSLDAALRSGKPTVVIIATPSFCESRLCGPEVETVQTVSAEIGDGADFVHIEYYRDDKDAPATKVLAPAAEAWKATIEPGTFFIGADGVVADRLLGPMDLTESRERARALLA